LFLVERKTRRRIMRRRILKKLNPCWKVGRRQVTSLVQVLKRMRME
jgi:hypothetical protein